MFSKGNEVEVPVVLKVVSPMARVPLVREMVVSTSTLRAFSNSSKSRELEVTNLVPAGKIGTLLKVQVPVTISSCDKEAGPPSPQSRRT